MPQYRYCYYYIKGFNGRLKAKASDIARKENINYQTLISDLNRHGIHYQYKDEKDSTYWITDAKNDKE